jgi:hypothetical protein
MGIYIQIGAGAGDLDSRANFRDGFSEYVKKLDTKSISKIILVEPKFSVKFWHIFLPKFRFRFQH